MIRRRIHNRWLQGDVRRGAAYDERFGELARSGANVHGEADFVASRCVGAVLDAGCGTGRLAIELDRRGYEVVGVDLDDEMLAVAREKSPSIPWFKADLADFKLNRTFAAVVMAGNVMIFLSPGAEREVLCNLARHLEEGGLCIAGFSLQKDRLDLATYDLLAKETGLHFEERWSTWDKKPFLPGGDYAVSVHRKVGEAGNARHRQTSERT